MSAGPPPAAADAEAPAAADAGPAAAADSGAAPEPSWADASLEDILTVLALGHGARLSASPFACLPIEIVNTHIRRAVETAYWGDRCKHGLITPPQSPRRPARMCPGAPMRPKAVRLSTCGEQDDGRKFLARPSKRLCFPLLEPSPGPPPHATSPASSYSDFEPQALFGGCNGHVALTLRKRCERMPA